MSQSGYTPILIYSSSTASNAPAAGNLTNSTLGSELAINITDGKLFYKDNANAVQVIGWKTVPATAGGTGQTSYAVGDILYANTTTTLAKLADVATGNALISGGVGVAPSWGKIGLTTHVSGVLPVANGGTNASSASITAFNNITGYSASGATGTTSTNLVFSTSPTLTTPIITTTLGVGNATPSASGSGITFPATQSASTDPNTLDDYEEGTYTPTIFSVVVGNGTVYGRYVLCGNMVFCSGSLIFGSTTTVSTYIRPSVPFVADGGNGSMIGGSAALTDSGTATYIEAAIGQVYTSGDTYVKIQNSLTGQEASNGSPYTFTTNDRIDWAFIYRRA